MVGIARYLSQQTGARLNTTSARASSLHMDVAFRLPVGMQSAISNRTWKTLSAPWFCIRWQISQSLACNDLYASKALPHMKSHIFRPY